MASYACRGDSRRYLKRARASSSWMVTRWVVMPLRLVLLRPGVWQPARQGRSLAALAAASSARFGDLRGGRRLLHGGDDTATGTKRCERADGGEERGDGDRGHGSVGEQLRRGHAAAACEHGGCDGHAEDAADLAEGGVGG